MPDGYFHPFARALLVFLVFFIFYNVDVCKLSRFESFIDEYNKKALKCRCVEDNEVAKDIRTRKDIAVVFGSVGSLLPSTIAVVFGSVGSSLPTTINDEFFCKL